MSYRGSRKHVLDWTNRPTFPVELLRLVAPVDCKLLPTSAWAPVGYRYPDEARLETATLLPPEIRTAIRRWWLAHEKGANTPNWDIAVSCEVAGRAGLILVEAKANEPELSAAGKAPAKEASEASAQNHERIGVAIGEACAALQRIAPATALSRDSHYQLANRIAFAWKLASLGIPTVLVYLGFVGDHGIADAGTPFDDAQHWQRVFDAYSAPVLPKELQEVAIDCGAAPMWVLVRSREVSAPSPSRPADN